MAIAHTTLWSWMDMKFTARMWAVKLNNEEKK